MEAEAICPDLTKNKKQEEFVNDVLIAASGGSDYRYMCYGGAVGGAKTFSVLTSLIMLSVSYPGSKWAIFRASNNNLEETTLPSIGRILYGNTKWKFNAAAGHKSWTYLPNGSQILFMSENYDGTHGELNHVLGLEINGAVLEQAEEVSQKLFDILKTRIGRWKLKKMPKPIILMTLNPSQNWVKDLFYLPFHNGVLEAPLYFKQASVYDNLDNLPDKGVEYLKALQSMPDREKRRLLDGDWSDLRGSDNRWAYAFDREKHIMKKIIQPRKDRVLYLSFDFNINPIVCSIIQHIDNTIYVHETLSLANSDIYKLCNQIKSKYIGYAFNVTGDASGNNGNAALKDALNYYLIIRNELKLAPNQFAIPKSNPRIEDNQVLVNALLQNYGVQLHPELCKTLIFDLENVRMSPEGKIQKERRDKLEERADSLDSLRYYMNTFHRNFVMTS